MEVVSKSYSVFLFGVTILAVILGIVPLSLFKLKGQRSKAVIFLYLIVVAHVSIVFNTIVANFLCFTGNIIYSPIANFIPLFSVFPFMFLFIQEITNDEVCWTHVFWHLLPTACIFLFIIISISIKSEHFIFPQKSSRYLFQEEQTVHYYIIGYLVIIQQLFYCFAIMKKLNQYKTNRLKPVVSPFLFLCYSVWTVIIVPVFYPFYNENLSSIIDKKSIIIFINLIPLYFIYMIGKTSRITDGENYEIKENDHSKYGKSLVSDSEYIDIIDRLEKVLKDDKIYTNPEINLYDIAEKTGFSRHNISQVINRQYSMGFYDYMNKWRVDEAIELIKNGTKDNLLIISTKVGFNSQATFFRAFKKFAGIAPSEYKKKASSKHYN